MQRTRAQAPISDSAESGTLGLRPAAPGLSPAEAPRLPGNPLKRRRGDASPATPFKRERGDVNATAATAHHGAMLKISPSLKAVDFGDGGSRNQPWARAVSPPRNGCLSAPGWAERNPLQSSTIDPSHAPLVPPESYVVMRCVGAFTHNQLELMPHGDARTPLSP